MGTTSHMTRFLRQTGKGLLKRAGVYESTRVFLQTLDPRRNQYRRMKQHTCTVNGHAVTYSTADEFSNRVFFPKLLGGGLIETRVTRLMMDALANARVFADVGANLGWYTCLASAHMPEGTVHAFEMDRVNYGLLQRNVELNGRTNVQMHNMAIASTSGVASYARDSSLPRSTLRLDLTGSERPPETTATVRSVSLDDFFADREPPDVLKIDVEGAEREVLRGMTGLLSEARPLLFLEIHPHRLGAFKTSTADILSVLREARYDLAAIQDMRNQSTTEHPLVPITRADQINATTMVIATPA